MARNQQAGTEWIARHRKSLSGAVGGGGLAALLFVMIPEYNRFKDVQIGNSQKIAELEKRLDDYRETQRTHWQKISALQLDIERVKARANLP